MSQITAQRSIKSTLLKRNYQNYISGRFGQLIKLSEQDQYYRNVVNDEYLRRKQLLNDATTKEEVEAVSINF